jgi:carboxypeptidase C (cathepsin A)
MKAVHFLGLLGLILLGAFAQGSEEYRLKGELPLYGPFKSKNYAGYIDLPDTRKGFFWFVESERDPVNDPLVLWLNGGPGCSSLYGNVQESGPYLMRGPPYEFRNNSFTFVTVANMLYLESPPGVGFSLDTNPPIMWDDNNTAHFNYAFLKGWFAKFPQFRQNDFFIAGESYGGHYVPQLANRILEGDDAGIRTQMKGFMVGNPCTSDFECSNNDPLLLEFLRTHGFAALNTSIGPSIPNAAYDPYDILKPTCPDFQTAQMVSWNNPVTNAMKNKLAKGKHRIMDHSDGSYGKFADEVTAAKVRDGPNPGAPFPWGPCEAGHVHAWMNRRDIKAALHAPENVTWHSCSPTLNYNDTDAIVPVTPLYEKFFEQTNWSIMFYSGLEDSVVNFISTQTIVSRFNRPLVTQNFTPWHYPYVYDVFFDVLGGFYLKWDRVSWAGVRDAGHMVPMFNPPAAHELFKSFLETGGPGRI